MRSGFWRTAAIVGGRELRSFFLSPIAAIVGTLFLVLEGLSFWGLVDVLSNPAEPAPFGAVFSTFFGGTLLYWAILFAVIAALTMRLYADEKRSGTWETLFTAGASEGGITVGKYAAALATYAVLWLPTIAYVVLLSAYAPDDVGLDSGPIVGAYLGVALVGAALIGLGLFASALTSVQVVAALLSFTVAMLLLLASELGGVGASVRAKMFELSAGLVTASTVVVLTGGAVTLVLATHAAIARGRRRRLEVTRRAVLALSAGLLTAAVAVLCARANLSADLTRGGVHTLEPETELVLDRVSVPLEALVARPTIPGFVGVFEQVEAVLDRMSVHQPLLRVRVIDPATTADAGGELLALAAEFAVPIEQLREGGAVVFQSGSRRRLLDVTEVAAFDRDRLGAARVAAFWAETAFTQAIAEVSERREHTVCASTGAGEVSMSASTDAGLDWSLVADRLRRDGVSLRDVVLARDSLQGCDGVLVVGPRQPLSPEAAIALESVLASGRAVLVAVRSQPSAQQRAPLLATGLELVLAERGVRIVPSVVIDPAAEIGVPRVWSTYDGYGDHPVSSSFRDRRATVWPAPRAVETESGVVLVHGSSGSWPESNLDAVYAGVALEPKASEGAADVAVAVATTAQNGARLVVFGSAEVASSQLVRRGLGAGHLLAARAIRWMVGRAVAPRLADKSPEHLRLLLSPRARQVIFAIAVLALPAAWLLIFLLVWWSRRG